MLILDKIKKIYFIGIGGIGMSGIAEVLFEMGFSVSGSDVSENSNTKRLEILGIKVNIGHYKKNISNIDLVVVSSAIKDSNVEVIEAKRKNLPIMIRAKMLAELMHLKYSITVAGSHGKTTTTSIIACLLEQAKFDPTVINGGIINNYKTNAKLGNGKWIVAEADESDGSFIYLPSTICLINNIDPEHLDYYKTFKKLKEAFITYAKNIPFYGFVSLCIDDKNINEITRNLNEKKIVTYGINNKANFYAKDISIIQKKGSFFTSFNLIIQTLERRRKYKITTPLLGEHNLRNTLGAISIAKNINIEMKTIKKALKNFKGVKRRFTLVSTIKKNKIFDDYAHHPKEILATLGTLRKITKGKIFTIFQPHRYSRTKDLFDEFKVCFKSTDYLFVLPVYGAGEKPLKGYDHFSLIKAITYINNKFVYSADNKENLFSNITKKIKPFDNIIFLGAGSVTNLAYLFPQYLKDNVETY